MRGCRVASWRARRWASSGRLSSARFASALAGGDRAVCRARWVRKSRASLRAVASLLLVGFARRSLALTVCAAVADGDAGLYGPVRGAERARLDAVGDRPPARSDVALDVREDALVACFAGRVVGIRAANSSTLRAAPPKPMLPLSRFSASASRFLLRCMSADHAGDGTAPARCGRAARAPGGRAGRGACSATWGIIATIGSSTTSRAWWSGEPLIEQREVVGDQEARPFLVAALAFLGREGLEEVKAARGRRRQRSRAV